MDWLLFTTPLPQLSVKKPSPSIVTFSLRYFSWISRGTVLIKHNTSYYRTLFLTIFIQHSSYCCKLLPVIIGSSLCLLQWYVCITFYCLTFFLSFILWYFPRLYLSGTSLASYCLTLVLPLDTCMAWHLYCLLLSDTSLASFYVSIFLPLIAWHLSSALLTPTWCLLLSSEY